MSAATTHNLKIVLELKWKHDNDYEAKVSVTTTDSCYHAGELKSGLPPATVAEPEVQPLTFNFTHDEEKPCAEVVKTETKTIIVRQSIAKTKVTAFAVVNSVVAGSDTKDFPRR